MSTISKSALKAYFLTGSTPTEAQFAALIDACHNLPGGLFLHRFVPDNLTGSVQLGTNLTKFHTNGPPQWFNMLVFIPPGVSSLKSFRLVGQNYRSFLQQLRVWYFSDVPDSALNPFAESPGYWHALYQSPVPLPSGAAPQDFDVQIPLNKNLQYNTYRYFLLQLNIRTLVASGTLGAGALILKPFGLEYE